MKLVFKFLAIVAVAADKNWWEWIINTDNEEVAEELQQEADAHYKHEKSQWDRMDVQFGPDSAGFSDSEFAECIIYHNILSDDATLLRHLKQINEPEFELETMPYKRCKVHPLEYQRAEALIRPPDAPSREDQMKVVKDQALDVVKPITEGFLNELLPFNITMKEVNFMFS